jgi:hypothetical protein
MWQVRSDCRGLRPEFDIAARCIHHRHPEAPERSGGLEGCAARLHPGHSSFEAPRALLRIARFAPQDDGVGSLTHGGAIMYGF